MTSKSVKYLLLGLIGGLLLTLGLPVSALTASEVDKFLASDGANGDSFGWSVVLDGDTALIGALNNDDNGSSSGAVYVFVRTGNTWSEQTKLAASDGSALDRFGVSVALDDDTAIVGAYGDDDGMGSAYVFVRNGDTWSEQAKLTPSDGVAGDRFGENISIDGDTVVIGTFTKRFEDGQVSVYGAGAAYVFVRGGDTWTEQARLTASDFGHAQFFGGAVALDGETAVIGSFGHSGAAYVFVRSGNTWSEQAKITPSDAFSGDHFGNSVALDADTAVIGAIDDDDQGSGSGSAYVFTRVGTTWTEQAKLTASDGEMRNRFGSSVALLGDMALIGAIGGDGSATDSGSVYVFTRSGTTWTEHMKLTARDSDSDDRFGFSVALDGDTAVIGAYHDDDNGAESGSAYVYDLRPCTLAACGMIIVRPSAMRSLGVAVAPGEIEELSVTGGDASPFVVPSGKVFVLTDIFISPQQFPTSGFFSFQVTPSAGATFTTGLTITSSVEDPSSFQVNLSSGMVFQTGSKVRIHLRPGAAVPVNVSAFGYLAEP